VNLEVFSCAGGMAEGLRRAGLTMGMAFDVDPEACDSYDLNLGHRPVQMDARDLLRMARAGWHPGPIDLLVVDPPCTPWSRAGKRLGQEDERDMLAVTVDLVRVLKPRAYLFANVPGLDDAPNWPTVQNTIGSLSREGYCVVDFVRLDAADYGVPQHRIRPFWYGHRSGACVRWPEQSHEHPDFARLPTLGVMARRKPWVTCREALAHLSPEQLGAPVRLRWKSDCHPPSRLDEPSNVVPSSQPGNGGALLVSRREDASNIDAPARTVRAAQRGQALLVNDKHPVNRPDEPSFTVTTKGDGRGAQGACVLEWPWNRPSTTVCAGIDTIAPPNEHAGRFGPNAVKLSELAGAILQGFPESWVFAGKTKRSRWSMIGQAMPPPLAEAVGRSILAALRKTEAA
jgi:site-specific DNA-cytosine methylase